jgi:hypothetical protein
MSPEELERLSKLMKRLRGVGSGNEESVRGICNRIKPSDPSIKPINYNSWNSWENRESTPRFENFRQIASLSGWTLDQLDEYLRTGNENPLPVTPEAVMTKIFALPIEERAAIAQAILGGNAKDLKCLGKNQKEIE